MKTRARSVSVALALGCTAPVFAQVSVDWERIHAVPSPNIGLDGCVEIASGGFWASGAEYFLVPNFPSPTYIGRTPLLLRLDAEGQLLDTTSIPLGFSSFPTPVLVSTDAQERAYLAFKSGNIEVRTFDSAGVPAWSTVIPNSSALVAGGFGSPPWGGFTAVVRTPVGGLAVTSYDAAGTLLFNTTLLGPQSLPSFLASVSDGGRAACAYSTGVFVVNQLGNVEWSATFDFTLKALTFGHGGELVLGGVTNAGDPVLRVHEVDGALRFTTVLPQGTPAEFSAVAADRFGTFAAAGSTNGTAAPDSTDGLAVLFAANGTPMWTRTWVGASGFGDAFTHALITDSGDVHAAGITHLTSATPYHLDERRLVVASWDRAGNSRWSHVDSASGTQMETTARLLEDGSGRVVSAGTRWNQNFVNSGYAPIGAHFLALHPQSRGLCYGDAQSAACPCGGQSAPGAQSGCINSFGTAARLVDSGLASLANDTLVLSVSGTTPSSPGLYFQGSAAISPVSFGDGLRCAGGTLTRLYTRQASGGASSVPALGDPTLSARSAAAGDVLAPGTTRIYQVSYRDLASAFCPPPFGANQNASSALAIAWAL